MTNDASAVQILTSDSATKFAADPVGAVVVTASHGGEYPAYLVAKLRVRAAVFNDASTCKDRSGIAGLAYLEKLNIPAATVAYTSARIGHGNDTLNKGVISFANAPAQKLGCVTGMPCAEAAQCLRHAELGDPTLPEASEARQVIITEPIPVVLIDSASLVAPEDINSIVITGSHGGLLGGNKPTALKYDAVAAFYNDAGIGLEDAGISRLPALEERGIAGITVAAASARIGIAKSTYEEGIISALNPTAEKYGGKIGMPAREIVDLILQAKGK